MKYTTELKADLPNATFETNSYLFKKIKLAHQLGVHLAAKRHPYIFCAGILPTLLKLFVYGVSELSNDVVT